jgi:hypothetical protein
MSRLGSLCVSLGAWLCLSCSAPSVVKPVVGPNTVGTASARTIRLCADLRMTARGHHCVAPLRPEEQRHRAFTARLELEEGRVTRFERLNGRGTPEPDDDGCVEFRYRFDGDYIAEHVGYRQDGTVCDRALWTERATRMSYVNEWGRPDFSRERVNTGMLLDHDANGMVVRQRPFGLDGKPAPVSLAFETRIERDAARLEKRTCSFDAQGRPIKNANGVHCWSFERDRFGNDLVSQAWDERGKPTATGDGVHRIVKEFDRYGNLVKRRVFGLDGRPPTADRVHCASFTYHRDEFGFMTGTDCRNAADLPARFDEGNSHWRATPDHLGRSRETRYFDAQGKLMTTDFGYARIELDRDAFGHVTARRFFLADGRPGQIDGPAVIRYEWSPQHLEVRRSFFHANGRPSQLKGCASTESAYDQYRQAVRQTCRDAQGKPVLSSDNVSVTGWSYDERGLLAETRYSDTADRPIDSKRGFARKVYRYDERGLESGSRHFKADGSEVTLPRYSVLWVRPPLSDAFWPRPSRAHAVLDIEAAHRDLLSGLPWHAAVVRYGDEKVYAAQPGDAGYLKLDTVWPALRAVLEPLQVGQYSRIVEIPYGFAIYQRTE